MPAVRDPEGLDRGHAEGGGRTGTPLGIEAKRVMDSGALLSDDIILGLVTERIGDPIALRDSCLTAFPAPSRRPRAWH